MRTTTARTNRLVFTSLGCLLALLIVVGAGCGKQETPPTAPEGQGSDAGGQSQTPAAPDLSATPVEPNAAAAIVNGEIISEAQLNERIDAYLRSDPQVAMLPAQFIAQIRPTLRPQLLDVLVGQVLLRQKAREAGFEVSEAEAMAELEKTVAAQDPPMTIDQLKELLAARGGNFAETLAEYREGMMLDNYLADKFADQMVVTEEDAKAFYDANPNEFEQPELVRASHILLGHASADPNSDPNKVKAEELLAQIREGADFAELAQLYSVDKTSKVRGGDVGLFPRERMVPEFADAAFALEPNEVSDVVESEFGYHIIKMTGHQDARIVPFDEIKGRIIEVLEQEKRGELVGQYVDELKQDATIEYPADANAAPALPAAPTTLTPAPITRTPRPEEPVAEEDAPVVIEPNAN